VAITVIRAGMLTTVQDLGRPGHRAAGVPPGGAMDAFALRLVNLLVGNAEKAAGLEFTLVGPELEFTVETTVALGGAEFGGIPRWQPIRMQAGERLQLGAACTGCRGYLAIAGGLEVPPILGGRGTYLRAAFGGHDGRALRNGDRLRAAEVARQVVGRWRIDEQILPAYSSAPIVRVVAGAQANEFDAAGLDVEFKVSPKSDRMGVRLIGPALVRHTAMELVSAPTVPGTVQVPPDGQPIALMADAQTLGGYPQIAHAITVDLPLLAQARPGNTVRFRRVTLETAHRLLNAREHAVALLREGLLGKLR